jgi:hypothetical protein
MRCNSTFATRHVTGRTLVERSRHCARYRIVFHRDRRASTNGEQATGGAGPRSSLPVAPSLKKAFALDQKTDGKQREKVRQDLIISKKISLA